RPNINQLPDRLHRISESGLWGELAISAVERPSQFSAARFLRPHPPPTQLHHFSRPLTFAVRSSLPFSEQNAKHHKELVAALDVVKRACHLCVDVKKSLFSGDGSVLEKNDQTPVTIADFGVQALAFHFNLMFIQK
ncbi:unnamed protein product, partial [Thlaspi arvense]